MSTGHKKKERGSEQSMSTIDESALVATDLAATRFPMVLMMSESMLFLSGTMARTAFPYASRRGGVGSRASKCDLAL